MRSKRYGFTIIEVSLFLAITAFLFVGIITGVQNSMFYQHYNDSVQSFAEFLRSIYSQTSNTQNSSGDGRSKQAIYGRLVVFGETKKLDGTTSNNDGTVFIYDVVGQADSVFSGNIKEAMKALDLNVVVEEDPDSTLKFAGNADGYKPRWGASIQSTVQNRRFYGAILVIRHPSSGTIHTLVKTTSGNSDGIYKINQTVKDVNNGSGSAASVQALFDNWDGFDVNEVNFCINPNGNQDSPTRRNVRMIANARNASGIETIDLDSSDNECK